MTPAHPTLSSKAYSVVLSHSIVSGLPIRRTMPPNPKPGRIEVSPPLNAVHFPSTITKLPLRQQKQPFPFTARPASI
jgi:hypothetical protein